MYSKTRKMANEILVVFVSFKDCLGLLQLLEILRCELYV